MIASRLLALGLFAGVLAPVLAEAAPVNQTFAITASGFSDVTFTGATPPFDPVTLRVAISFDTSTDIFNQSAGLTVLSSTIPLSSLSFSYDHVGDALTLGGASLSGTGLAAGTNDVLVLLNTAFTGAPTLTAAFYTNVSSSTGVFASTTGTVIRTATAAVPEPASLALLVSGIAAIGLRRRQG